MKHSNPLWMYREVWQVRLRPDQILSVYTDHHHRRHWSLSVCGSLQAAHGKKPSSYPSKAKNPEFQTSRATLRPDLLIRCIRQVIHQQCTKFTQRHSQFSSVTGNATGQLSNRAPSRSKISDDKRSADSHQFYHLNLNSRKADKQLT